MAFTSLAVWAMFLGMAAAGIITLEPQIDSRCQNKTFCIYPTDNYPQEAIDELLQDANWIQLSTEQPKKRDSVPENVCLTYSPNTAYIYTIIDTNGDVRYVVQSEKFRQIISVVECQHPGRIIPNKTQLSLNIHEYIGVQPVGCKQRTTDYKFLVLSKDLSKFETASPRGGVPTCCTFVHL